MVQGIIIPASDSKPLVAARFETLEDDQRVVGGWIEAVDVADLGATMYVNEEGLIRGLPFNRRATFLWWFHVPAARGDARLVGDAAVVGLPDSNGSSTDIPPDVRQRLLKPGRYRVLTREAGEDRWRPEPVARDDYIETIVWATLLRELSSEVEVQIQGAEDGEPAGNQP